MSSFLERRTLGATGLESSRLGIGSSFGAPASVIEDAFHQVHLHEQKELFRTMPIMYTWDDHDYCVNDAGVEFAKKEQSKELFLDFFGVDLFARCVDAVRASAQQGQGAVGFDDRPITGK